MKTKTHSILTKVSVMALLLGASSRSEAQTYTFGSDNDGLAGFTQSTAPDDPAQTWTTEAASVRYRSENTGNVNSSFLKAISLDRSVGKSYRMTGAVTLSEGYADDNNRVGMYLFGDSSEVPNQDEVGAIGMIFNMDDGVADTIPDSNADDDFELRVGIDANPVFASEKRNQTTTPFAQDLFGTTITFTVDLEFFNDGTDDRIQIEASLTESSGDKTTVSASVLAAEYTGDYFGFVTRARSRNFGVEGDPRSAPWVMDYKSFTFSKLSLSLAQSATPGNFDFTWVSKDGKVYDLVSDTALAGPVSGWPVWQENSEILPSGTGINTLTEVPGGGNEARFFAVVEREPTPLLEEDFDEGGPDLPVGWSAVNATTVWDVGDPSGLPGLVDGDGTTCVGTNVVAGSYADEVATVTLTSPPISIPAGGATLAFRQYIDSDLVGGDFGTIRLLDASDTEIVEGDFPITGIDGITVGWTNESHILPPSAAGQDVKLVFEFTTAMDGTVYSGFYVDDVIVTNN